MLGGIEPLLDDGQHGGEVAAQEGGRVEPQPRKDRAAQGAVSSEGDGLVAVLPQDEPVDLSIEHTPDDILVNAVAPVGLSLIVQVVADAAGGDLGDQVGGADDVAFLIELDLPAMFGLDEQEAIGLRDIAAGPDTRDYRRSR